ncbi:hypothetical protein GCM10009411_14220 [Shewanella litoralis]|uniref:Uncharacterized protein n=1 Tax=Shewanella litoralis TaxID=2282700 RepID=A0ABQ2R5K3_9GAMM|nr:hypothetical protein GCM10009411_14220 [Shewanella litoralis]
MIKFAEITADGNAGQNNKKQSEDGPKLIVNRHFDEEFIDISEINLFHSEGT